MIYKDKNMLPSFLYNAVVIIERSQDSEFIKAYKKDDGWRLVFKTLFNNSGGFSDIESYLEKQFNDDNSCFEELCIENDQQIIYLTYEMVNS